MKKTTVEEMRQKYNSPIIGIAGSTFPIGGYTREMGIKAGYVLREFLNEKNGCLCTGGVEGIGTDAYTGIMKSTIKTSIKNGVHAPDKFFVIIPSYVHDITKEPLGVLNNLDSLLFNFPSLENSRTSAQKKTHVPPKYSPPEIYGALAELSQTEELLYVRAGQSMTERRKKFAEAVDVLVVINGGEGTLDEAINALNYGKHVITVPKTGGVTQLLEEVKYNPEAIADYKKSQQKFYLRIRKHDTAETPEPRLDTSKLIVAQRISDLPVLIMKNLMHNS